VSEWANKSRRFRLALALDLKTLDLRYFLESYKNKCVRSYISSKDGSMDGWIDTSEQRVLLLLLSSVCVCVWSSIAFVQPCQFITPPWLSACSHTLAQGRMIHRSEFIRLAGTFGSILFHFKLNHLQRKTFALLVLGQFTLSGTFILKDMQVSVSSCPFLWQTWKKLFHHKEIWSQFCERHVWVKHHIYCVSCCWMSAISSVVGRDGSFWVKLPERSMFVEESSCAVLFVVGDLYFLMRLSLKDLQSSALIVIPKVIKLINFWKSQWQCGTSSHKGAFSA